MNEMRMKFWGDVYIAAEGNEDYRARLADKALEQFDKRFKLPIAVPRAQQPPGYPRPRDLDDDILF